MLTRFRELGPFWGTLYPLALALKKFSAGRIRLYAYHLVAQPVTDKPMLPPRRGRGIEVREIGLQEAVALPVDRPREIIEARFRQGARCLMASSDGRFLGFLWILIGPYEEDEVRCRFVPVPAGLASWDFDVFVEPSARLSVAFARLWDEANQTLSSYGVKWSISRISAFNAGSLASHRRLGLVRIATAAFVRAGSWQLMLATIKPYVHVAMRTKTRPTLEVGAG